MKTDFKRAGFTLTEILVVVGIFSLIIGVTLTLLTSGRFSVNLINAQIEAAQHARQAMNQISTELRLSQAGLVHISDSVAWTPNNNTGSVLNLQIPVGSYAAALDLENDGSIKWGSEDSEGAYIAYSISADSRLIRSTYITLDGSDAVDRIITPGITRLQLSRTAASANFITIVVEAQAQAQTYSGAGTGSQRTVTQTLTSSLRLRN